MRGNPVTVTLRGRRRLPKQVYPRVCGGTVSHVEVTGASSGLSPRVRGNQVSDNSPVFDGLKVYPRVCGGTRSRTWLYEHRSGGLSPRVRGNPHQTGLFGTAGVHQVYPRVCGGTSYEWPWLRTSVHGRGLSPRVRGNRRQQSTSCSRGQVYPRVCGETWSNVIGKPPDIDPGLSPRVRGNRVRPALQSPVAGLSPRVRGNRVR